MKWHGATLKQKRYLTDNVVQVFIGIYLMVNIKKLMLDDTGLGVGLESEFDFDIGRSYYGIELHRWIKNAFRIYC